MKWLQNTYTCRFNTRHRLWGRLFGDRYKSVPVESGAGHYYALLLDYIHLNPVRAGLINPVADQSVLDYPWSSVAGGYALPEGRRAKWLAAKAGWEEFGYPDTVNGRRKFVNRLDQRASGEMREHCGIPVSDVEVDGRMSHLRRGWYWGSQAFSERLLKIGEDVLGRKRERNYRYNEAKLAHATAEAQRMLKEGLEAAGLDDAQLRKLPGADMRKVALAERIWMRTTVSQEWIAEKLWMRSAPNVSQLLKRWKNQPKFRRQLPSQFKRFLSKYAA